VGGRQRRTGSSRGTRRSAAASPVPAVSARQRGARGAGVSGVLSGPQRNSAAPGAEPGVGAADHRNRVAGRCPPSAVPAPASPAPTSEPPTVTVTATAAAPAGPPMAHGAVLGAPCDHTGPTFGYTSDGQVLACPYFGHWSRTANWSGVHEIGSPCPGPDGSAASP
jgi:hypothetical protein